MESNPYRSPTSSTDNRATKVARNYGYHQVSWGYALLAIYVLAGSRIVAISTSTRRIDKAMALEFAVWLIPLAVLVPAMSLLALRVGNPKNIRYSSAILLLIFLLCSTMIFLMWETV